MSQEKLTWLSTVKPATAVENNSRLADLFTDTDIFTEHSKLVRESIQNGIDARLDNQTARMRFFVGMAKAGLGEKYFGEQKGRFEKCLKEVPDLTKEFKYVVVEDFNTSGLMGSLDNSLEKGDPKRDSFFYFTWATGSTNKGGGKGGKNGVGKVVYEATSRIHSYLVFSCRDDARVTDEPSDLLFGKCVLEPHEFDGKKWLPESQWMIKTDAHGAEAHIPSSSLNEINDFLTDFSVSRSISETGTSILIPFVNDNFSAMKLAQCVAQDYFIAILDGRVEVVVEDSDGFQVTINSSSIKDTLLSLDENIETKNSKSKAELIALCDMHIARSNKETELFVISENEEAPNSWGVETPLLSDEQLQEAREALYSRSILEFKVPVVVPKKGKSGTKSRDQFTVLIKKDDKASLPATFSREGILIPRANPKQISGSLALVLVEPGDLANLLGLSEGPAHQIWSWEEEKFKGVYSPQIAAEELIKFVKNSASRVLQMIQLQKDEWDDLKYGHIFSLESESGFKSENNQEGNIPVKKTKTPPKGAKPSKTKTPPKLVSDDFDVSPIPNGFRITRSAKSNIKKGDKFEVKVGYDVSSGNPLALTEDDFTLSKLLTKQSVKTVSVIKQVGNHCTLKVEDSLFQAEFVGFDGYRDLAVSVTNDN
jgi:hypothetical protein